jgi:predicted transcriptional regulator
MDNFQTISWIFLATALASNRRPTNINGISSVADGINHAIPTQKELQNSISWLIKQGLILKQGKIYELTSDGKNEYEKASKNTKILMSIRENIEKSFNLYKVD